MDYEKTKLRTDLAALAKQIDETAAALSTAAATWAALSARVGTLEQAANEAKAEAAAATTAAAAAAAAKAAKRLFGSKK